MLIEEFRIEKSGAFRFFRAPFFPVWFPRAVASAASTNCSQSCESSIHVDAACSAEREKELGVSTGAHHLGRRQSKLADRIFR
jgi:hypothetical protein